MTAPIIDQFIRPDFTDPEYVFGFIIEGGITLTFLVGVGFMGYLQQKNRLLNNSGGKMFFVAFLLFFFEALMNFIDGNFIWFNETTPFLPLLELPAYQTWRLIRFLLVITAYYFLIKGFIDVLNKAKLIYGIEI